jgi:hypothetical protein
MDQQVAERIRRGWRAELGAPAAFGGPGRHVHLQPGQDPARAGWVRVVALGDSACVSLPPSASTRVHDLLQQRGLDADLTDPAVAARVIGPVEEVVGPATLAFLDPTIVDLEHDPRVTLVPAGHQSVRHLVAASGPDNAEESGILDVESAVVVWQVAGRVVAASGSAVAIHRRHPVRPPRRCPLQLIGRFPDHARTGIECGAANAGIGAVGTADDCHGDGGGSGRGGGPGRPDRPRHRATGGDQ